MQQKCMQDKPQSMNSYKHQYAGIADLEIIDQKFDLNSVNLSLVSMYEQLLKRKLSNDGLLAAIDINDLIIYK